MSLVLTVRVHAQINYCCSVNLVLVGIALTLTYTNQPGSFGTGLLFFQSSIIGSKISLP